MARKGSSLGRTGVGFALFAIALLLVMTGRGNADSGLSVEYHGQLAVEQALLWGPGRLAVGGDGSLYVADGYRNRVVKLSSAGAYLGEIRMPSASAVAVAPDGTLYIGSHKDYSVLIVKGGKSVGQLGAGKGEFSSITDIAIDNGKGNVYVADTVANVVKVYDASGKRVRVINGLHLPMGVAIAGPEVYILNAPKTKDASSGEDTTASQVAVYDKAGNFVRNFGESGVGECKMARPTGIAVAGGKAYITDAGSSAVLVYDLGGSCLGEVAGGNSELAGAVSLALSQEGNLYVSTNGTQSIQSFVVKGAGK